MTPTPFWLLELWPGSWDPFDFDYPYNVLVTLAVARQLGPFDFDYPYNVLAPFAVARQLGPFGFDGHSFSCSQAA